MISLHVLTFSRVNGLKPRFSREKLSFLKTLLPSCNNVKTKEHSEEIFFIMFYIGWVFFVGLNYRHPVYATQTFNFAKKNLSTSSWAFNHLHYHHHRDEHSSWFLQVQVFVPDNDDDDHYSLSSLSFLFTTHLIPLSTLRGIIFTHMKHQVVVSLLLNSSFKKWSSQIHKTDQ